MPKLVVIDGPEKAGKTTLIDAIVKRHGAVRYHWGKVPVDPVYGLTIDRICKEYGPDDVVIWDRGWASECVYARLLDRERRLRIDPWLGEWLYGRAFSLRIMLLGPHHRVLSERRDATDLPVNPMYEQEAFGNYARAFGWETVRDVEFQDIPALADSIWERARAPRPLDGCVYGGPSDPRVMFVGERRSATQADPGAYLPFTSKYTEAYGRLLGPDALRVGWTNAHDAGISALRGVDCVVACGSVALGWAVKMKEDSGKDIRVEQVPHPAWLYRWGSARDLIAPTETKIRTVVQGHLRGARASGNY